MTWTALHPSRRMICGWVGRRAARGTVKTIGLDLAKNPFQVHGAVMRLACQPQLGATWFVAFGALDRHGSYAGLTSV